MTQRVVLVDASDRPCGIEDVVTVHRPPGLLHRAFSVFVFNRGGDLLLQRRSGEKERFRGKWSNSCCGHARPDELLRRGAERRVTEELGLAVALQPVTSFVYTAGDEETGFVEREYDWVLVGRTDDDPILNPREADAYAWAAPEAVRRCCELRPSHFTPWFPLALNLLMAQSGGVRGSIASSVDRGRARR